MVLKGANWKNKLDFKKTAKKLAKNTPSPKVKKQMEKNERKKDHNIS
jgi:hypothetical protein